jgi:phosphatidylglycerophosphate synthase
VSAREVYRATKKVPDLFWNTYVCRPPAAVLVSWVAESRVTPNQITLASFAVAVVAAALLVLVPGYWGLVAAIVVYELSYVLDCADGMLARLRKVASQTGHLLDFLMDELKAFLILGASAVRLYLGHGDVRYLLVGIGGLVMLASGIAMTTFERRPEVVAALEARRAPLEPRPTTPMDAAAAARLSPVGLPLAVAKLLVHYPSYIWLAAALGRLELYFWPYVAVHTLYALRSLALVAVRFGR